MDKTLKGYFCFATVYTHWLGRNEKKVMVFKTHAERAVWMAKHPKTNPTVTSAYEANKFMRVL